MTDLLPDEVWAQLDPAAARLGKVSRRVLIGSGIGLVVLATLVVLAVSSGLLSPQLGVSSTSGSAGERTRRMDISVTVQNTGWFTEHVDAVDVATPGIRVMRASGVGIDIRPGRSATIAASLRVVDCARIHPGTRVPLLVRLHRFWGEKTLSLAGADTHGMAETACTGAPPN